MPELHDVHDLEALVAFVDGELAGPDAEAVQARMAACPECAGLAADLRAMAVATRTLSTPARPRDFQLTAADAARLMPDAAAVAAHTTHDAERVVAFMDGALDARERPAVASWLSTCTDCARLRDDLAAIADAHRALPTPARAADYRLTDADAARLSPGGWRGWLARIGTSRDVVTRPLALGLTAIGIAGLLVSAGPLLPFGSATQTLTAVGAAAPGSEAQGANGSNTGKSGPTRVVVGAPPLGVQGYSDASAAPSMAGGVSGAPVPVAPAYAASAAPSSAMDGSSEAPVVDDSGTAGGAPTHAVAPSSPAPIPVLPIVSLVALAGGLALVIIRRRAGNASVA